MVSTISKITESIYMSGCYNVHETTLRALGIRFVVNCTQEVPFVRSTEIESIRVSIEDSPYTNINIYFDRIGDRINEVTKRGGKVLVHCVAGVSRSASLVLAYLVKHRNMSLRDAHAFLLSKRSIIHPNNGFWQQLVDYERQIRGNNSVRMVHTYYGTVPDIYQTEGTYSYQPVASTSSGPMVSQRVPASARSVTESEPSSARSNVSYADMLMQITREQLAAQSNYRYQSTGVNGYSRWGNQPSSTLPPLSARSSYAPAYSYRYY